MDARRHLGAFALAVKVASGFDGAMTEDAHATEPPPPTRGIVDAVWRLLTPASFDSLDPTWPSERFSEASRPGIEPLADVYRADGPGPHPSVVIVHGGGFVIGSRRMKPVRYLISELVPAGYTVAAFDYRMIFRGGRLTEALSDVADMMAWWRTAAARFDVDPARVSMLGLSAGAALMLLHAAAAGSAPLHRIVSIYGLYDFDHLGGRAAVALRRLLLRTPSREAWRARSPLTHAEIAAPVLLVHGTEDSLVPVEHAHRLYARRTALGLPTELQLHDGLPHGYLNDARLPASQATVAAVLDFLAAGDRGA